ncbi:MAG: hypothetical protein Q9221_002672 [Calogaya cf. arnoldii]
MSPSPLQQEHQVSYTSNQSAQQEFQSQYNLDEPSESIISYMRYANPSTFPLPAIVICERYSKRTSQANMVNVRRSLHEYTKAQLETINRSKTSRRIDAGQTATLESENSVESTSESVKSTAS